MVKKSVLEKFDELLIFEDRVEDHSSSLFKNHQQSMRYEQIAQVVATRGMVFSELVVESTGGGRLIAVGLKKEEADLARDLIERKVVEARRESIGVSGQESAPQQSIPDQIRQLGELKKSGLITQREFEEKKQKLLNQI